MESHRYFHFIGSPYKHVVAPYEVSSSDFNKAVRYSELFGDEQEELRKLLIQLQDGAGHMDMNI